MLVIRRSTCVCPNRSHGTGRGIAALAARDEGMMSTVDVWATNRGGKVASGTFQGTNHARHRRTRGHRMRRWKRDGVGLRDAPSTSTTTNRSVQNRWTTEPQLFKPNYGHFVAESSLFWAGHLLGTHPRIELFVGQVAEFKSRAQRWFLFVSVFGDLRGLVVANVVVEGGTNISEFSR